MRYINKKTSTKPERIFIEILKANHIPFKHRVKISDKEIDFTIGYYAIEIDGHRQSSTRNDWLFSIGYTPIHYSNKALLTNRSEVEKDITNRYHGLQSSHSQRSS